MRLTSIADVAAAVRGRRMDLGISQGNLAQRAGVSRKWVNQFERGGRTTAEIGTILRVLDALGLDSPGGGRPWGGGPGAGNPRREPRRAAR